MAERRLPADDGAPATARRLVRSVAAEVLPEDRAYDVELLVSELVTNALLHATLGEGGWIGVSILPTASGVRVEVSDSSPGFDPAPPDELPAPADRGGRGLWLLAELATRWGYGEEGASRVWFELDRGPAA